MAKKGIRLGPKKAEPHPQLTPESPGAEPVGAVYSFEFLILNNANYAIEREWLTVTGADEEDALNYAVSVLNNAAKKYSYTGNFRKGKP